MNRKVKILSFAALSYLLLSLYGYGQEKSNIIIVVAKNCPESIKLAAHDMAWHLNKSTGKIYQIIEDTNLDKSNLKKQIIAIGESKLADEIRKDVDNLQEDEFLIKTVNKKVFIVGKENDRVPATHYGVSAFLEKTVNAKWIWPGEQGTFISKSKEISIENWDYKWKSEFEQRSFCSNDLYRKLSDEAKLWMIRHRLHKGLKYSIDQSFKDWHMKYPQFLADDPREKGGHPTHKFKINSPAFLDLVVEEILSQNSNQYSIAPPDGKGFEPSLLPDKPKLEVWNGGHSLTKPYLEFWAKVDNRVNKPSFKITLMSNIYSSYYYFPENFSWNGKNFVLNYVSKLHDYEEDVKNWNAWKNTGAKLILRPNWWGIFSFLSISNFNDQFNFFEFSQENGSIGFFFDVFQEMWSTRGFQYYVMARLSYSGKTLNEVKNEYYNSFGEFGDLIKESHKLSEDIYKRIVKEDPKKIKKLIAGAKSLEGFEKFITDEDLEKYASIFNKLNTLILSEREKQSALWYLSGVELTKKTVEFSRKFVKNSSDKKTPVKFIQDLKQLEKKYPYSFNLARVSSVLVKYKKSGYTKEDHKKQIWGIDEELTDKEYD